MARNRGTGMGTATRLAHAEIAGLEPPQGLPDLVELMTLPAFEAREQILGRAPTRALHESARVLSGQRGELIIRGRHGSEQAGPSLNEQSAQLFSPLRSRALALRSRPHDGLPDLR